MRKGLLLSSLFLLVVPLLSVASGAPKPPLAFTHGIASGEVTDTSAVLWTRANREVTLKLEVSTNANLKGQDVFKRTIRTTAREDFTTKVVAAPLAPNTTYYYRWRHGNRTSAIGTFHTAPAPDDAVSVRFAYSGDSDGTKVNDKPFFNNFETLDAASMEDLDFFIYLGDTVISDSPLRGMQGPATTLEEYREVYQINREYDALRHLMQTTSLYTIWDDHEVFDNYDGQTVDPTRYANGRQAFLEYMPVLEPHVPDPTCAGDPLFRVFQWGKDVDLIILDERSCRSASVEAACLIEVAPNVFVTDLAPTLPVPLRVAFNAQLPPELQPLLPPLPPPGCLAAINEPSRTMLGARQKALFKAALLQSQAKFKFVINEVSIQQYFALPYDNWEGYGAERTEILNFIQTNAIENVIFLTTDFHGNLINEVSIDALNPVPVAHEFVTGPIADLTAGSSILLQFGPEILDAFHLILDAVGVDCRHLDVFSYGVVSVDTVAGTATITLKDETGAVVQDQRTPGVACQKTIGP